MPVLIGDTISLKNNIVSIHIFRQLAFARAQLKFLQDARGFIFPQHSCIKQSDQGLYTLPKEFAPSHLSIENFFTR